MAAGSSGASPAFAAKNCCAVSTCARPILLDRILHPWACSVANEPETTFYE